MLQIAGLPRSTFYGHRRRLSRRDTRIDIKEAIRGAFEAATSAYGHRRILSVLFREGWRVSKKTVLKLMRELGSQCAVRRGRRYNSFRGEVREAADNVLNRQFGTGLRHIKWATDVTEFNIGSSKVYVSPILDLYDNRIISATVGRPISALAPCSPEHTQAICTATLSLVLPGSHRHLRLRKSR